MNARVAGERAALIAWSALAEPGDEDAGALVAALGAADALAWVADAAGDLSAASVALAHRAGPDGARRAARAHERWWRRLDVAALPHEERAHAVAARVLTRIDPEWPVALADLGDRQPFALYVIGPASLRDLWGSAVAVVGARSATAYGAHVAHELASSLASGGLAVMSGGAFGIDAAAHRGALAAGGHTVAVMAGGIDRLYPAANEELLRRVAATTAVVAEVPPGFAPHRSRFLARNRLIAAAAGTVVVEAAHRSGALSTARHAAGLLRPVGAFPGPVTSASSSGCHALIRERVAELVADAADVRELVGPLGSTLAIGDGETPPTAVVGSRAVDFDSPAQRAAYDVTRNVSKSLDEIASSAGLALRDAAAACAGLEARGLLDREAGGFKRARKM